MTLDEAIDRLKEARAGYKEFLSVETLNMAIKALEQKTGHWIHYKEKIFVSAEHWECSWCHRTTMTYPFCVNGNDYDAMYYCPKCGCRMVAESEEA